MKILLTELLEIIKRLPDANNPEIQDEIRFPIAKKVSIGDLMKKSATEMFSDMPEIIFKKVVSKDRIYVWEVIF